MGSWIQLWKKTAAMSFEWFGCHAATIQSLPVGNTGVTEYARCEAII